MANRTRGRRKQFEGVVISDKMDKTVVVRIDHRVLHPIYKKYVKRSVRYKAHDAQNQCRIGDRVRIEETRPLSKEKRWKVVEVLERAL